jgi:hypothetical protein
MTAPPAPLRVLALHWAVPGEPARLAVSQHLRALESSPAGHEIVYCNAYHGPPRWLAGIRPDAVLLHTTFLALRWHAAFPVLRGAARWVGALDAIKVALPQDEYDRCDVLDDWLCELGVQAVLSCYGEPERALLYPRMALRASFHRCLTGYLSDVPARRPPDVAGRALDLGYRGARLGYRFGWLGQLKQRLADEVAIHGPAHGLRIDVSTDPGATLHGQAWPAFLASARATVGSESGASAIDRDGGLARTLRGLERERPGLTFAEASAALPAGWDGYSLGTLGPRHLEAAATGTAQLLVRGEYAGVLEPWTHYVPIEPDLCDLDAALERVNDHAFLQTIADRAYADVAESGRYTFASLAGTIDEALALHGAGSRPAPPAAAARMRVARAAAPRETSQGPIDALRWASALASGTGPTWARRVLPAALRRPPARALASALTRRPALAARYGPRAVISELLYLAALHDGLRADGGTLVRDGFRPIWPEGLEAELALGDGELLRLGDGAEFAFPVLVRLGAAAPAVAESVLSHLGAGS